MGVWGDSQQDEAAICLHESHRSSILSSLEHGQHICRQYRVRTHFSHNSLHEIFFRKSCNMLMKRVWWKALQPPRLKGSEGSF